MNTIEDESPPSGESPTVVDVPKADQCDKGEPPSGESPSFGDSPDGPKVLPFDKSNVNKLRSTFDSKRMNDAKARRKAERDAARANEPEPVLTAYEQLKLRDKRFVDAYIMNHCNGAAAVRAINYKCHDETARAWSWLQKPLVRAAIEERKAEVLKRSADRLVRYMAELDWIASFDYRQLIDRHGNVRPLSEWPAEVAGAMQSVEIKELYAGSGDDRRVVGTVTKFTAWPKIEAIKVLMQYHKALAERHEHTGANGGPIAVRNTDELSDDQLAAIAFGGRPALTKPETGAG